MKLIKDFYTIQEVSDILNESKSLLRFWEKEFKEIRPQKNYRGIRVYKKSDIEIIITIHNLIKVKGFTIEGAKKELKLRNSRTYKTITSHLVEVRSFFLNLLEHSDLDA